MITIKLNMFYHRLDAITLSTMLNMDIIQQRILTVIIQWVLLSMIIAI